MASEINTPERPRGTNSGQVGSNKPSPPSPQLPPPSSSSHILVSAGDCSTQAPLESHGNLSVRWLLLHPLHNRRGWIKSKIIAPYRAEEGFDSQTTSVKEVWNNIHS